MIFGSKTLKPGHRPQTTIGRVDCSLSHEPSAESLLRMAHQPENDFRMSKIKTIKETQESQGEHHNGVPIQTP